MIDNSDAQVRTFHQKSLSLVGAQLTQDFGAVGNFIQGMSQDELVALYASLSGLRVGLLVELIQRRSSIIIPSAGA